MVLPAEGAINVALGGVRVRLGRRLLPLLADHVVDRGGCYRALALIVDLTSELLFFELRRLLQNCRCFRAALFLLLLFLKGLELPFEYSLIIAELFLENSYVLAPLANPDFIEKHGIQH